MSITAQLDNGDAIQFASNKGWGDLCRWSDTLDAATFAVLVHLCEHGWTDNIAGLRVQLNAALENFAPPPDVQATVNTLAGFLVAAQDDDVLTVTDGMETDDGSEE